MRGLSLGMLLKAHRSPPVEEVIPTLLPLTGIPTGAASRARMHPARPAPSFRYVGITKTPKVYYIMAVLVSAGLHAGLLLGFNHHLPPPKPVVVKDAPTEMLIMPDLSDPEEDKLQELNDDDQLTAPAIQVPMLQDVPISVPVDSSFTQLIDPTVPTKIEGAGNVMAIPLNIQRGRPDTSGIKNLFNIADLDRRPEPIVQTPPVFPYELKQTVTEAQVRVGFIVTSRGDVIMPYIVSSTHSGFERAALDAVSKWRFKPGQRGGRKVNTRVEQPITFTVTED